MPGMAILCPALCLQAPTIPWVPMPLHLALIGRYLIHGTDIDKIYGIGMQITHGCVRMYPNDIEALYRMVAVGTPVYIIKQPIKVGWLDSTLYIEAHPGLDEEEMTFDQRHAMALRLIKRATNEEMPVFDQEALNQALQTLDGEPVPILRKAVPQNMDRPELDNFTVPYQ